MTVDIAWSWCVRAMPMPTLVIEARHTRADGVKFALYTNVHGRDGDIEHACHRLRQTIEEGASRWLMPSKETGSILKIEEQD